ncbi:hypothetical protein [cf. Phormidesmis sp. LEGE 11477]|uniref:hypothetical protein n=1 Tax=cf. Phormidesmis sp. LEGE 11477 TaxID=1828680 RepID=UPI00187F07CE|nr:hypothetical protein [cf. Phormidesmis sp. LEGE 11477]MBE9060382.1 hypothetical protein [cf. Phormidesmis sp. LEGE 11477]
MPVEVIKGLSIDEKQEIHLLLEQYLREERREERREEIYQNYSFPHFACYTTKGYTSCSIAQSAIAKCECIRASLYQAALAAKERGELKFSSDVSELMQFP